VNSNERANQPEAVVESMAKKLTQKGFNVEFYEDQNVLRIKRKYFYGKQQ